MRKGTAPIRIRGRDADGQHIPDLGPLTTVFECQEALRTCLRAIAAGKDPKGWIERAATHVRVMMWSMFQTKGLEIKGFNMDQADGQQTQFTTEDYADRYKEAQAELRRRHEEVEALRGQIAAMQGRERPRPPRPTMN